MVVALALAAVFGSMSLANPAWAQDDTVTDFQNLYIETTATTIVVTWDAIDGHDAVTDYEGRWAETTDLVNGNPTGSFNAGGTGGFAVDISTTAARPTATISGLSTGREVTVQMRSAEDTSIPVEEITATPTAPPTNAPTTPTFEAGAGEATLKWNYTQPTGDTDVTATGWQYQMGTDGPWMTIPNLAVSTSNTHKVTGIKATQAEIDTAVAADPTADGYPIERTFNVRALNGTTPNTTSIAFTVTGITTPPLPRLMLGDITATAGDGEVTLSWARVGAAEKYSYIVKDGEDVVRSATDVDQSTLSTISTTVMNLDNDTEYTFEVTAIATKANADATPPVVATHLDSMTQTVMETPEAREIVSDPDLPTFKQSSNDPGDSANFTVKFQIDPELGSNINTRNSDLVIEFHEDYGVPASIRNTSVAITTKYDTDKDVTFTPEDVTVDGEKILLSLGDMDERDDMFDYEIRPGEVITVHFRQSADITTATEDGGYFLVEIAFGDFSVAYDEDDEAPAGLEVTINRKISLSEDDGGLGDVITATGKGYKNGTTLTVFDDSLVQVMWDNTDDNTVNMTRLPYNMVEAYNMRVAMDEDYGNVPADTIPTDDDGNAMHTYTMTAGGTMYAMAPNRRLDLADDVLCKANIGGDDVGKCEFTVSHPVFNGGVNYVNAVDGRDQYASKPDTFILEASIQAKPASGSPGESIVIQLVDFPPNRGISSVQISRDSRTINCVGNCSTDQNGAASFSIVIPNWVKSGTQDLRVTVNDANDNPVRAGTTVNLAGPRVVSTPQTVVANQRVSLVGTGFSPNAELGDDTEQSRTISKVSIGGYNIPWSKINDGRNVSVDDSGNWSASMDLPLVEATTGSGNRLLRVTDSFGRTGAIVLNVTERDFEITPPSGRVGTLAVVRGTGYPGKNDEGDSFTIDVTYKVQEGSETRVSVVPDASGRFEVQIRIPTTAPIPSTNQVEVTFDHEVGGTSVTDVKQHSIPEGLITTSVTSGGPGSMVTLSGEGFKTFSPVESVKIGAIEITPAPKPSTDANGMMEFDILIPGLDVGIQTIEVKVGGTTSSVGFTVTASGVNPGDIKPTAEAMEPLGENLESVWHFNNDSKAWSFYDGLEGSDLNLMVTGETYLIQIKSTVEVILNQKTRTLTCNAGNCWNQIVW